MPLTQYSQVVLEYFRKIIKLITVIALAVSEMIHEMRGGSFICPF